MIFMCGCATVFVGNLVNGEKPTLGCAICTAGYGLMGTSVLMLLCGIMP
jgi:hypothetical protein